MIIVNIILGLVGIISFIWMMVGLPIGGIWLLISLTSKEKKKLNVKKWLIVTFGGMAMLPIVFMLYALLMVGKAVTGVDDPTLALPTNTVIQTNSK